MSFRVQNYNKRNKEAIPELWKLLPLAKFCCQSPKGAVTTEHDLQAL